MYWENNLFPNGNKVGGKQNEKDVMFNSFNFYDYRM